MLIHIRALQTRHANQQTESLNVEAKYERLHICTREKSTIKQFYSLITRH